MESIIHVVVDIHVHVHKSCVVLPVSLWSSTSWSSDLLFEDSKPRRPVCIKLIGSAAAHLTVTFSCCAYGNSEWLRSWRRKLQHWPRAYQRTSAISLVYMQMSKDMAFSQQCVVDRQNWNLMKDVTVLMVEGLAYHCSEAISYQVYQLSHHRMLLLKIHLLVAFPSNHFVDKLFPMRFTDNFIRMYSQSTSHPVSCPSLKEKALSFPASVWNHICLQSLGLAWPGFNYDAQNWRKMLTTMKDGEAFLDLGS